MKRSQWLCVLLLAALALASCAHQPAPAVDGAPGFWSGLWNGWIAPFALIGHIFNHEIRIYAFPNSGGWYDFGFVLGIGSLGGGTGAGMR